MTDSILIGKTIYNILSADTTVASYVGTRIWPIIAKYKKTETATYPFIVYSKSSAYPRSLDKDGTNNDYVTFEVSILAEEYNTSIYIANAVRKAFENHHIMDGTLDIDDIKMNNITESFLDGDEVFLQTLTFSCNVDER